MSHRAHVVAREKTREKTRPMRAIRDHTSIKFHAPPRVARASRAIARRAFASSPSRTSGSAMMFVGTGGVLSHMLRQHPMACGRARASRSGARGGGRERDRRGDATASAESEKN